MECIDANFLTQVIQKPMWGGALLDFVLTSKKELAGYIKVGRVALAAVIMRL